MGPKKIDGPNCLTIRWCTSLRSVSSMGCPQSQCLPATALQSEMIDRSGTLPAASSCRRLPSTHCHWSQCEPSVPSQSQSSAPSCMPRRLETTLRNYTEIKTPRGKSGGRAPRLQDLFQFETETKHNEEGLNWEQELQDLLQFEKSKREGQHGEQELQDLYDFEKKMCRECM